MTPVSQASPQIESLVVSGQLVPTSDFIILAPGSSAPAYHVHLQNVFVTSYHLSSARDGRLEEEFTLAFTNVTVEKTAQALPGNPGTTVTFQRDLSRQGDVLDDFASEQQNLLDQRFTPATPGIELNVAGIPGDSTDAQHPGAIDIVGFSTAVNSPRDTATGQAGGRPQFQSIQFVSPLSAASPALLSAMVSGQTLATADLTVPSALRGIDSYTIHLDNVRVVSDQIGTGPAGAPQEEFSLTYAGILVTYVPQDPAGPGAPVQFAENLQANHDATTGFAPPQQSLFAALGPQASSPPLQPPVPTPSSDSLFLTVPGVSGPSTDAAHPHSIPLVSWGWGADAPLDPGGSGAPTGGPQFEVLHLLSDVSQASPQLMQLATSGQDLATVELDARHAGAASDYYVLRLTDARVGSYEIKQGQSLLEEFTLTFRQVQIQAVSNSGTPAAFTYNLNAGSAGLLDFAPRQASLADNGFELSPQQMFLSLPGIPGGSTDRVHVGQIVVDSFDWGESANGRIVFDELHVVAPLSIASPLITQAVLAGSVIPTADLFVRRPGTTLDYYTIHLEDVQITSQQTASGPDGSEVEEFTLHFGGATGSIAGRVFNDVNHNAVQDPGEPGLAGLTLYIDLNHDGVLDPTDPVAVTDSDGAYRFIDLAPGAYTVRQVVPGSYGLTAPLGYAGSVSVSPGQTVVGPTFGDTQRSTVPLDFSYLLLLAQHFGRPGTFADGDLNGDGTVNFADLLTLAQNYGRPLAPASLNTAGPSAGT